MTVSDKLQDKTGCTGAILNGSEPTGEVSRFYPGRRGSGWRFWASGGSFAVLDQALVAASNFILGIFLARWLTPVQFGAYALTYAGFLLVSVGYQALILEPQQVFGSTNYAGHPRQYLGILLRLHFLFALILIALGVGARLTQGQHESGALGSALSGVTLAAPCVLLMWLARGAFYVRMAPQRAAAGSALYCTVVFGSLAAAYRLHWLSPFSAFVIMAFGAIVSSSILLALLRPALRSALTGPRWTRVCRDHWTYGRWIVVSSVLNWLTSDIYFPALSAFSGVKAAGELKVLLNFSLPAAQTFSAISIFILPYASRMHQEQGGKGLGAVVRRLTAFFAAAVLAYWVVLTLCAKTIILLLYNGRYAWLAPLVPLVAAGSIPWTLACVWGFALRAAKSSASVLGVYTGASSVAVLFGIPAARLFGLRGALWGIVLSNTVAMILGLLLVRRTLAKASELELKNARTI